LVVVVLVPLELLELLLAVVVVLVLAVLVAQDFQAVLLPLGLQVVALDILQQEEMAHLE
jgi:hypothetical protein